MAAEGKGTAHQAGCQEQGARVKQMGQSGHQWLGQKPGNLGSFQERGRADCQPETRPWAGTPGWKEDTKVKKWALTSSPYGGQREHLEISFLQRQPMRKKKMLFACCFFFQNLRLDGPGEDDDLFFFFLKAGPQSYYLWEWRIDSAS